MGEKRKKYSLQKGSSASHFLTKWLMVLTKRIFDSHIITKLRQNCLRTMRGDKAEEIEWVGVQIPALFLGGVTTDKSLSPSVSQFPRLYTWVGKSTNTATIDLKIRWVNMCKFRRSWQHKCDVYCLLRNNFVTPIVGSQHPFGNYFVVTIGRLVGHSPKKLKLLRLKSVTGPCEHLVD